MGNAAPKCNKEEAWLSRMGVACQVCASNTSQPLERNCTYEALCQDRLSCSGCVMDSKGLNGCGWGAMQLKCVNKVSSDSQMLSYTCGCSFYNLHMCSGHGACRSAPTGHGDECFCELGNSGNDCSIFWGTPHSVLVVLGITVSLGVALAGGIVLWSKWCAFGFKPLSFLGPLTSLPSPMFHVVFLTSFYKDQSPELPPLTFYASAASLGLLLFQIVAGILVTVMLAFRLRSYGPACDWMASNRFLLTVTLALTFLAPCNFKFLWSEAWPSCNCPHNASVLKLLNHCELLQL